MQEAMTEGESRGRDLGRAEGRAEGETQNRVETAQRMLGMKFTTEQISQATGLSLNEVEALKDKAAGV